MFQNTRGLAYTINIMTKMHRMSQYPLYMHHRIECVYSAFLKMLPPLFNNENGYQKLRGMLGDTKHAPRVRHQSFHCKKSLPTEPESISKLRGRSQRKIGKSPFGKVLKSPFDISPWISMWVTCLPGCWWLIYLPPCS